MSNENRGSEEKGSIVVNDYTGTEGRDSRSYDAPHCVTVKDEGGHTVTSSHYETSKEADAAATDLASETGMSVTKED